jgi:hypothetical protein
LKVAGRIDAPQEHIRALDFCPLRRRNVLDEHALSGGANAPGATLKISEKLAGAITVIHCSQWLNSLVGFGDDGLDGRIQSPRN